MAWSFWQFCVVQVEERENESGVGGNYWSFQTFWWKLLLAAEELGTCILWRIWGHSPKLCMSSLDIYVKPRFILKQTDEIALVRVLRCMCTCMYVVCVCVSLLFPYSSIRWRPLYFRQYLPRVWQWWVRWVIYTEHGSKMTYGILPTRKPQIMSPFLIPLTWATYSHFLRFLLSGFQIFSLFPKALLLELLTTPSPPLSMCCPHLLASLIDSLREYQALSKWQFSIWL